jgi:hypothetical protein
MRAGRQDFGDRSEGGIILNFNPKFSIAQSCSKDEMCASGALSAVRISDTDNSSDVLLSNKSAPHVLCIGRDLCRSSYVGFNTLSGSIPDLANLDVFEFS